MARILVIDDDEVTRLGVGAVLEGGGHQVAYARDGDQGMAFYERNPFDLVIVDLAMPVKSGLQTIRELTEAYRDIRIIAITGVSPEQLPLAEDYGAARTLIKPVEPNVLMEVVGDVLKQRGSWDDVID